MIDNLRKTRTPSSADSPADKAKLSQNPSSNLASTLPAQSASVSPKSSPRNFRLAPTSKREWLIGGAIIVVLVSVGGLVGHSLYRRLTRQPADSTPIRTKVVKPPKTTEPSRLSGVEVPFDINKRPVTAIMIENSPDARPQSGLLDAGVVFEAIAEGGITRFMTLFLEGQPNYIGPVRSVRPYYLDWLMPFDAAVVHAGGSGQALNDIRSLGVKDLDHGANGQAFQRINNRFAPHNLYTSMANLDQLQQSKGFSSKFSGFTRKAEKANPAPTARSIDFNISSGLYNSHFDYDAASNSYKRSEGGKPHVDERSGTQLQPKVVIGMIMNYSRQDIYSVYQTTGSGKVYVFQDGVATEGTWSKAGRKDQLVFNDANGQVLKLNPGQTWIIAVADAAMIVTKP